MEAEGVRDHLGATPERAVFVGGGPLPLSALRLAESHGWTVEVVERDSDAAAAARGAVAALGVDLPVREADGAAVDYGGYDLVHVAALVDPDGADGVFDRVHDTADDGALLLGRSAHGRRRALYPALPDRVHERFDHLATRRPPGDVINSAVFFRA
jgi:nicotianamine synthase